MATLTMAILAYTNCAKDSQRRDRRGKSISGGNFKGCNNKEIGAELVNLNKINLAVVNPSPIGDQGHTHTASTTAGRTEASTSLYGVGDGTRSGGVPTAQKPGEIDVTKDENFGHMKSLEFLICEVKSSTPLPPGVQSTITPCNPKIPKGMRVPLYDNQLLNIAEDLARRLLPAFDAPTGIPFGSVNLLYGVDKRESKIISTAGRGTLTLEFGVLSRLTNDPIFEQVTMNAVHGLWARRSKINLVGAHINVFAGEWTQKYIFQEAYAAAMHYLYHDPWYVGVNIDSMEQVDTGTICLLQGVVALQHHTLDSNLKKNLSSRQNWVFDPDI